MFGIGKHEWLWSVLLIALEMLGLELYDLRHIVLFMREKATRLPTHCVSYLINREKRGRLLSGSARWGVPEAIGWFHNGYRRETVLSAMLNVKNYSYQTICSLILLDFFFRTKSMSIFSVQLAWSSHFTFITNSSERLSEITNELDITNVDKTWSASFQGDNLQIKPLFIIFVNEKLVQSAWLMFLCRIYLATRPQT